MPSLKRVGTLYGKIGWYVFTSKVSLQTYLYMTHEDYIFVADVVVIDLM
jgi:exosortase/archaeosortase